MSVITKYIVIFLGALLGLAFALVLVLNLIAQAKLDRRYGISVDPIAIPESESALQRGKHLVRAVSACVSCHGQDLGGEAFIDEPIVGQIYAPNLTSGKGGKASRFSSQDWVHVLRHGVDPDGRPLIFMPSHRFRFYSDADLGAIVAYIRSAPPVDNETPPRRLSVTGRIFVALSIIDEMPAEVIDHSSPPPPPPVEAASPEYGGFLVTVATCKDCHGEDLAGGQVGPNDPFAPNLSRGGELVGWTETDFFTLMRTGVHAIGRMISTVMPWQAFRNMTDTELKAIWAYLQGLPALPTNEE